ncbi:MAG: thioredoxin family protein [Acidobacteriota bacterium]|nr:thioredoxin family protein [Acidobacteriota bacterium]MDQ7088415.1 thioredoxin family protein [Acidobacteriota bacterium]
MKRRAGVVACVLALVLPLAAGSDSAETPPLEFLLTAHFQLRAHGQPDPDAKIYVATGQAAVLVLSETLQRPVLLTAREKTAQALEPEAVTPDPEDPDRLLVDPNRTLGRPLVAKVSSGRLSFVVAGKRVVVEPAEPWLGDATAAEILDRLPEQRRAARLYTPRLGQMRLLARHERPLELLVFLGSWCPHCERLIPRLIRVLEDLGDKAPAARFHLVPRSIIDDLLARQYGVKQIPLVIVFEGEKEIARLSGEELKRPEAALARVLFAD